MAAAQDSYADDSLVSANMCLAVTGSLSLAGHDSYILFKINR